jgi:lipopolysaccharide/colanic/teichoic acid biosynthesis glycosyltransferase
MELVLQAPTTITLQPTKPQTASAIYTKRILSVEPYSFTAERQNIQDNIFFTVVTIREAIDYLEKENVDAILINPEQVTPTISLLIEAARKATTPVIIYTQKFEQSAKEKALSIGADDYHFGSATTSVFLKRLDFIKKLKAYKNQRGNKPYTTLYVEEVPQIKLWTMKRAFDILISGTALLILSPILLLIALIIKVESKGPVFYISKRAGSGYRIFNFYKFRSMRVGADAELQKLAHLNQYTEASTQSVFYKIKNDPRVTAFGSFLRNTSLDEIPQLLNVLLGDMSLVGNRPLPLYEAEKLTKDQIAWRFLAPAGITGLWQITKRGRDNMSEEERIALDMEYAMKNSFWLDMKILLSTIPALLQKEKV